ncbi:MAG: ABC transporter ATP-binding protein [Phycisphaeraceae bacterium]
MSDTVIQVSHLSKRFRLGAAAQGPRTASGWLKSMLLHPVRQFRQLRGKVDEAHDFWALKDLSFDVAKGEVLGVIGRNGAGKSTLLKILSRITPPTEGEVKFRGRLASLLEVGTGFHEELTGRENVFMNGMILGMTRAEVRSKFDAIVDFAGVEKFIDTPTKRYSSGMKVRLGFAVAAHLDADILLIDEVLSVGDADFQRRSIKKMREIARSGRTIFLVSHNLSTLMDLSTRALVMEHGQNRFEGSPAEAVEFYLKSSFRESDDDLTHWIRPSWVSSPPPIQFISVRMAVLDRDLTADDPIELTFGIQAHQDVADVDIRVFISDSEGRRLVTCCSADTRTFLKQSAGDRTRVKFRIERSYLSAGAYAISFSAVVGTTQPLDYIENGLRFQVMPSTKDLFGVFHAQRQSLGLRLESTLKVLQEEASVKSAVPNE